MSLKGTAIISEVKNKKTPRLICKVCGEIFRPQTYRENITGTCQKEDCWRPYGDTEGVQLVKEDLFDYSFPCLKCGDKIYTDDVTERFCPKCRKRKGVLA